MGRCLVLAILVGVGGSAAADEAAAPMLTEPGDEALLTLDHKWPAVPEDHSTSMEDRITDHLTDWGNHVGGEVDAWSHHYAKLHVDGRSRRAQLHLGGGNEHLEFNFDSNWLFADGKAYAKVHLELALQGHRFELELPDMDLSHDSYHGEGLVQVNVSVLERRF
ncbi:MAG TPA: hypothetical protein VFQ65_15950 [Kofleriaceae bacterium]|nr:hypothetical protein [Kofleriaceae bacterium]